MIIARSRATKSLAKLIAPLSIGLLFTGARAMAATEEDVRVQGRVIDAKTTQPIAGATVYVRDWRTLTDADGRFRIDLPPGQWTIETWANRYQPGNSRIDACARCAPEVEILLIPEHFMEEDVTVTASANGASNLIATTPVRPVEVLNVAGAFENIFRVLHTLPGVTPTSEATSQMSVRGGGPDRTSPSWTASRFTIPTASGAWLARSTRRRSRGSSCPRGRSPPATAIGSRPS